MNFILRLRYKSCHLSRNDLIHTVNNIIYLQEQNLYIKRDNEPKFILRNKWAAITHNLKYRLRKYFFLQTFVDQKGSSAKENEVNYTSEKNNGKSEETRYIEINVPSLIKSQRWEGCLPLRIHY